MDALVIADSYGRFGDKSVIRHDAFDGRAFYVLFQKIMRF